MGLKKCSPQIFAGKIVVKKILIGKKRRVNPGEGGGKVNPGGGVEELRKNFIDQILAFKFS